RQDQACQQTEPRIAQGCHGLDGERGDRQGEPEDNEEPGHHAPHACGPFAAMPSTASVSTPPTPPVAPPVSTQPHGSERFCDQVCNCRGTGGGPCGKDLGGKVAAGPSGTTAHHGVSRISRTVASSCFTLMGLPWKPSNPAAMIRVRSWVIAEAVIAITGVEVVTGSARSCCRA